MDPITLNLRVGREPAASAPTGGELSAAEIDANFTNLKNAAEQLDAEKLDVAALSTVGSAVTPTAGDKIVLQRGSAFYEALVDTLIGGGGSSLTPLGLWDYWTDWRAASGNANAPGAFVGAAVSSGTNTTALPTGGMAGYNDHGVFLRSSTTADGGYRYQTTSLVGMYFGGVARKFRGQFLWRTSFTGRTVRLGFHDANTVADAVDGAYFEVAGSTCSAKTSNNSTRTTHATTITLSLDVAYTFDIEVNAAASEARFRVWGGNNYDTALMDVTITTNIPSTNARTFGAGIVATESSTTASDIGILYSLGIGTPAGFARMYGVYTPAATAPAAFTSGQWTAAATSTPGEISFDLTALPSDGGSAITSLEYRVNTGSAIAFTGTGTGVRVVTAGLTAGVAVDLQVRAVNAVGAGAWSDIKNRTPASAGGSTVLRGVSRSGPSFGGSLALTIPAEMQAGDQLVLVLYGDTAYTSADVGTFTDRTPASWLSAPSPRRLLISNTFGSVPGSVTLTMAGSALHEASVFAVAGVSTAATLGANVGTTGFAAGARDHAYTTTAANSLAVGFIDFTGGGVTGADTADATHTWNLKTGEGYNNGFGVVRASAGSHVASLAPTGASSGSEYGWAEIGAA